MTTTLSKSHTELCSARCVPCEGGVPKMTADKALAQLKAVPGWELLSGPDRIRRTWVVRNFLAGMKFFEQVSEVAEAEGHHPDLHLVGYRNVSIEIWTHAINGLSLNDFILAARIDELPIELKTI
jgi:4a-hydroxytetrahydrobiopterin dehydratase